MCAPVRMYALSKKADPGSTLQVPQPGPQPSSYQPSAPSSSLTLDFSQHLAAWGHGQMQYSGAAVQQYSGAGQY